jgi:hypothetical protein
MKKNTVKKFLFYFTISLIVFVGYSFVPNKSSLAVVTKTVKSVAKKNTSSDWMEISKGEILIAGDQLKTGKNSLAIIKFTDNSIIRVREQSELTILGEGAKGSMIKSAHLTGGGVGFDVKKQQNEQFRLTSPTSVASIRGTKGKWSGGRGHDTLIVIEGLVNLRNLISNKDIDVSSGSIGFSDEDGSISDRKASEDELADAYAAMSDGTTNELKLEMKDSKGNKKELKLRYKK